MSSRYGLLLPTFSQITALMEETRLGFAFKATKGNENRCNIKSAKQVSSFLIIIYFSNLLGSTPRLFLESRLQEK